MATTKGVWYRFVRLWAGKSTGQRALIVVGILILWPFLIIGALIVLAHELVVAVDRNHRLAANAHWAVSVFAVLGVLLLLSAVSPRPAIKATTDTAGVGPTATATMEAPSPALTPAASIVAATPEATPEPATPEPTPDPATPAPTRAPTATPDFTRDPALVVAMFESTFDITFEDSPLLDGTVRKLGRDSAQLVMVELTDDPIKSMSVSGPLPGSGSGTETTIGGVLGAEATVFGDPAGMTDWLFAQMKAAGPNKDRDVSKRFGKVVAHLNWDATILGWMVITLDHD